MKTAISIPDAVARDIDRVARHLRMSRSELLATAAKDFVQKHTLEARAARFERALAASVDEDDVALERWVKSASRRSARRIEDER
jgi:metal-responsive CopG/Arc/MetJ family transcriptional regulator